MKDIRRVLSWIFASTAVVYPLLSLRSVYAISRDYALLSPRYLLINLLIEVLFRIVVASITGMAWWTIVKRRSSARCWGTASLMYIMIFLLPIIFAPRSVWWHHVGALFVGIVGVVEFLWLNEENDLSKMRNKFTGSGSDGSNV